MVPPQPTRRQSPGSSRPAKGQASGKAPRESTSISAHSAADLVTLLKASPALTILLIVIPDSVRRERAVYLTIKHWLDDQYAERSTDWVAPIAHHNIEGSDARTQLAPQELTLSSSVHRLTAADLDRGAIASLSDSVASLSLFSRKEVTWIRDVEECSAQSLQGLTALFERFCLEHRLILSASALPAGHALRKIKNERFSVFELPGLHAFELRRWAERELKRAGFTRWDNETIDLLCLTAEESADQVVGMIQQLALYADSPSLTVNDIAQLFVQRVVPGEFDFLDALAGRNHGKCELMITDLLRSGKNPFMLLSLIARSFSNYLAIAAMRAEGVPPATIRQELGLSPWVYNKAEAILRRHSPDSLTSAIHTLVRVDSRLKNRSLGVDLLMSEMIDGIAHANRGPLPLGAGHS